MTSPYDGDAEKTGWPRGRWGWLFGSIVLLVLGVVFGPIFGSVWLGPRPGRAALARLADGL